MTNLDAESDVDDAPSHEEGPRPVVRDRSRRSRPRGSSTSQGGDPPADGHARQRKQVVHPSRMWPHVLVTLLCVGGLVALAWDGYRTSFDIKGGSTLSDVTNPSKPGYEAQVKPTPTHLVVTTTPDGKVGDAYLLVEGGAASASGDATSSDGATSTSAGTTTTSNGGSGAGGAVLFIPGMIVVHVDGEPYNLAALGAAKGMAAVVDAIQAAIGIGVTDAVELGPDQIERLFRSAGTLTIDNPDSLVHGGKTVFPAGTLQLQPADVAEYLSLLNDGEAIVNRPVRAQEVWKAWIAKLGEAGASQPSLDPVASVGDSSPVDLSSIVAGLAKGPVDYEQLPVDRLPVPNQGGFAIYQPDPQAVSDTTARMVPFPSAAYAGQRTRVRLFNGTTDTQAPLKAAQPIVSANSQIVILGNASSFHVPKTTVEYSAQDQRQAAEAIAAALGVGVVRAGVESDAVDVTVTLGADYLR